MLVGKFSNGTHAGLIRLNACLHKYLPAIIIPTVVAQWELIFCHSLGLVDTIRKMRLIYIHINGINLLFTFISFLYLLCIRYLLNSVTILYLYMYIYLCMSRRHTYLDPTLPICLHHVFLGSYLYGQCGQIRFFHNFSYSSIIICSLPLKSLSFKLIRCNFSSFFRVHWSHAAQIHSRTTSHHLFHR